MDLHEKNLYKKSYNYKKQEEIFTMPKIITTTILVNVSHNQILIILNLNRLRYFCLLKLFTLEISISSYYTICLFSEIDSKSL